MNARRKRDLERRLAFDRTAGRDVTHLIATSDRVRGGAIATPRKVMVTDRRVTAGRKESALTEFAQNRHEFTGDYVRRTPVKRSPVDNGSANFVRIKQLPTGTKPVWR
jgi:hypothetical protein